MAKKSSETPKRFNIDQWRKAFWSNTENRSGVFGLGLAHRDAALEFAIFVTSFTYLEEDMEKFLAYLMDVDEDIASHAMRSITSPQSKIKLLKNILERSRINTHKSQDFDDIINEFQLINTLRNNIVHAKYQVKEDTGEIYWLDIKKDTMLLDHAAFEKFDVSEITTAQKRMLELKIKISRTIILDRANASPDP